MRGADHLPAGPPPLTAKPSRTLAELGNRSLSQHGLSPKNYGFWEESTKDFLNDQPYYRNQRYGDKWYNQPAKFVDNELHNVF